MTVDVSGGDWPITRDHGWTRLDVDPCVLAETPLLCPVTGALWWIDIPAGKLFRLARGEAKPTTFDCRSPTGGPAVTASGDIIIPTEADGLCLLDGDSGELTTLWTPPSREPGRFNDGRVDPQGRFWIGWLTHARVNPGCVYICGSDGPVAVIDNLIAPNGIAFSPDGSLAYVTDSAANQIRAYRLTDGLPVFDRVVVEQPRSAGIFDGLAVDREGHLWTALYRGGAVCRLDPAGRPVKRLELPCAQTNHMTALCAETLAITTGYRDMSDSERAAEPLAGAILIVECPNSIPVEHVFGHAEALKRAPLKRRAAP